MPQETEVDVADWPHFRDVFFSTRKLMVDMNVGDVKTDDIALQGCFGGETMLLMTGSWGGVVSTPRG
jgi:hypothetical protein